MNMDFKSAKELLDLCEENQLPISEVMRQRECLLGETPRDAVDHRMAKAWEIMHASATQPLKKPIKSMGGLIGGEAKKLETQYNKKKTICGDVLQKAMTYAMAVLEVNASMGLIVAAPTAGSAGVVPGLLPTTGISLPFFSYGGTALMLQLGEMGILLNISRYMRIDGRNQE